MLIEQSYRKSKGLNNHLVGLRITIVWFYKQIHLLSSIILVTIIDLFLITFIGVTVIKII